MRVFAGYDYREAIGYHVFANSLIRHATTPFSLLTLTDMCMPTGTNSFTTSRFLVPYLCDYKGHAVFVDGADMLMMDDITKLFALFDESKAVQVVKSEYKTRHPLKYVGSDMQCPNMDYPKKNWASVMLINCGHESWRDINPGTVQELGFKHLLQFTFIADRYIGALPDRWNRLVDEGQSVDGAAILHWTAGIPWFPHYREAPGAQHWHHEKTLMEYQP